METRIVILLLTVFVATSHGQNAAIQWGYGDDNVSMHYVDIERGYAQKPRQWCIRRQGSHVSLQRATSEHNFRPDTWPELFPDQCAGIDQTPVDIRPCDTVYNRQLTKFIFYDPPPWDAKFVAQNTGKSIQVDIEGDFLLTNGGLRQTHRIVQYHIHWGSDNEIGAEHTIYGRTAPIEMHIVSWNVDKYSSFAEALTAPDGLVVLGILFRVSRYDNPLLEPLIQVIPDIRDPDLNNRVEIPVVPLREFLPHSPFNYYRYHGSLTTPPCYESVTWTVYKEKQTISERQLQAFRQTLTSGKMQSADIGGNIGGERERLVNNFRPVQPLNGRVIQRSYRKF